MEAEDAHFSVSMFPPRRPVAFSLATLPQFQSQQIRAKQTPVAGCHPPVLRVGNRQPRRKGVGRRAQQKAPERQKLAMRGSSRGFHGQPNKTPWQPDL